jgi:CBS-domain-containing membrane protein
MDKKIALKHIMTRDLVSVKPTDTLEHVQQKLTTHKIHHVPVVVNKQFVGLVSQSDLYRMEHHLTLFKTDKSFEQNKAIFSTMLAQDIMVTQIVTLSENDTAADAVRIFKENMFHALPVTNTHGELVGILTPLDLISYAFDDHPSI